MKLKTTYLFEIEYDIPNADQISNLNAKEIEDLSTSELMDFMLKHGLADAESGDAIVANDYSMKPEVYEDDGSIGVHAAFPGYFEVETSGSSLKECQMKAAKAFEDASIGDYGEILRIDRDEEVIQKEQDAIEMD